MHVLRRPVELAVVSGPLEKTYLELVPTSMFGATTDVLQAAGYDIWLAAVLPQSATTRPLAQHKTATTE